MVTADSSNFYSLYQHYKNGILPYGGGLFEQPNAYLQAMETIDEWSLTFGNHSET